MIAALKPADLLDARLREPGTAHRLACVRTGLAVAIGLRLGIRQWHLAGQQPPELFDPVFAVRWLRSAPPVAVLVAVQVVGVAAAAAAALGRRVGRSFVLAWCCYVFLAGVWSSSGKILHNEVLLILVAVPFLFAPADARLGDRSSSDRWGWPPRASLAVAGTVYFLAGFQKLRGSGLAWVTSDNLRWVLVTGARREQSPLPDLARAIANVPLLCQAIALGTLTLELAAPALLLHRRTRIWFATAATALHAAIWLTIGLDYWAWVACLWIVVAPPIRFRSERAVSC